jgi:predicted 2-oxoglutarate/Fe(II)-dependent dioxygenase YbiX
LLRDDSLRQALLDIKTNISRSLSTMPDHQSFLSAYVTAAGQ